MIAAAERNIRELIVGCLVQEVEMAERAGREPLLEVFCDPHRF
jgi:hypothetical protein